MKLIDLIGNELNVSDLVVIKPDHVVAQIVSIESGEIAKGISLAGPKPEAQVTLPHLILKIEMSSVSMALPSGQVPNVIKVSTPSGSGQKNLIQ